MRQNLNIVTFFTGHCFERCRITHHLRFEHPLFYQNFSLASIPTTTWHFSPLSLEQNVVVPLCDMDLTIGSNIWIHGIINNSTTQYWVAKLVLASWEERKLPTQQHSFLVFVFSSPTVSFSTYTFLDNHLSLHLPLLLAHLLYLCWFFFTGQVIICVNIWFGFFPFFLPFVLLHDVFILSLVSKK